MAGIQKICKLLGSITLTSGDGTKMKYLWDYVNDVPVAESEMPFGSERHAASERERAAQLQKRLQPRPEPPQE